MLERYSNIGYDIGRKSEIVRERNRNKQARSELSELYQAQRDLNQSYDELNFEEFH